MAMNKAEYLPEELIIDILYRLPVKSIGRCRCLSKQWNNFLSHPQFIKRHFNLHAHTQQEKLILPTWHCELYTITCDPQSDGSSTKVNLQRLSEDWVTIAGSCNGLVLLVDWLNVKFLINPTTLKYHQIPILDLALPPKGICYMYGLGYDVVSDDYKVVALSYQDTNNQFKTDTCVDIYSVRKGLWQKLENSPYDHSLTDAASGVFVNGVLHWLACRISAYSTAIAAFHLSVDKFSEIPGPIDLQDNCFRCNLATFKGCLCMSTTLPGDIGTITVWIMKEYGVKESWTKFKITEPTLDDFFGTLLCSINDDDDVLLYVAGQLVVYNMKENQRKDLLSDVNPVRPEARTFVDSLVSPYSGNETEG